jgi:RNA-binding protein
MALSLTSRQRKVLRGLAHALEPIVQIGKAGVSPEALGQIDRALEAHELIKVRFLAGKEEKEPLIREIVAGTGAAEAGRVGHVSILYRPHPDPEKRRIVLPRWGCRRAPRGIPRPALAFSCCERSLPNHDRLRSRLLPVHPAGARAVALGELPDQVGV